MRVLVATDAWHPQVNGVVRTLTSVQNQARRFGVDIEFLTPDGFPSVPAPTYPDLRLAIPKRREIVHRIEATCPDMIHIATEGPIGLAARAFCRSRNRPFTTSFMTKFPEYISARFSVPERWSYEALRRFHAPAAATMVATESLEKELRSRGFQRLVRWTRGVDTDLFAPDDLADLGLPRPIFMNVGRVAVEKNLDAFLSLALPGSKVVVGDGPQLPDLKRRYPDAHFLGLKQGKALSQTLAAADVFVFPSRTDTCGLVQLEALASGVPVAAFPVCGPRDVIGGHAVGALNEDLHAACMAALRIPREDCRAFALARSWEASAKQFIDHVGNALIEARYIHLAASIAA